MKIQSLPRDVVVELLHYLADFEPLEGLSRILGADFPLEDARAALREIAVNLVSEEESDSEANEASQLRRYLSREAQSLLASLSPREEKRLLKALGLVDS